MIGIIQSSRDEFSGNDWKFGDSYSVNEEQVRKDDPVGQAMLKKTGTPNYESGEEEELEEEQVHPDDKIGQSMLKKMGVPNYFTSDKKKQETHQKKVDEDQLDDDPINEMNTHPEDKVAQMMMKRLKSPQYFESANDQETHQLDVEKVTKKYVEPGYADTQTDAYGNTVGNLPNKSRAILVAK